MFRSDYQNNPILIKMLFKKIQKRKEQG